MLYKRFIFSFLALAVIAADSANAQYGCVYAACCPHFSICAHIECPCRDLGSAGRLPLKITICNHSCCSLCFHNSEYQYCVYDECGCYIPDALIPTVESRHILAPPCSCVTDCPGVSLNMQVLHPGKCYTAIVHLRCRCASFCFRPCGYYSGTPHLASTRSGAANIVVALPANGRLIVNDEPSSVGTRMQKLEIANLEAGVSYPYILQCEIEAEGVRRVVTRQVTVVAGQTARVDFNDQSQPIAQRTTGTATILAKVPSDATLEFNGETMRSRAGTQTLLVTGIKAGEPYTCKLRCNMDNEGMLLSAQKRVNVASGDVVRVDFVALLAETAKRARLVDRESAANDDSLKCGIIVSVPADAAVSVDGYLTKSTSTRRVFLTQPLRPGASYYHTVTAQVSRNGVTQSETKQVIVRAGESAQVSFALPHSDAVFAEHRE